MTGLMAYAVTAGLLFAVGLYGMLTRADLIHRLLGVNIMASAVFLFLVVLSRGEADPVPQAMVLTGIVITVSVSAFGLALARYLRAMTGTTSLKAGNGEPGGRAGHD